MTTSNLPVGSFVRVGKNELQCLVDQLKARGYRTIGPRLADGAIIYDELDDIGQLPIGQLDFQDGGRYRLEKSGEAWFDYVVGPHSLKNYLFPPRDTVLTLDRDDTGWRANTPTPAERKLAVIGPRSCDLHAMRVQDRVFLGDHFVDPAYRARREGLFVAAVNCRRAVATCFCQSMRTGPACTKDFDLAMTEFDDRFVIEIGSEVGGEVTAAVDWSPCPKSDIDEAHELSTSLEAELRSRRDDPHAASKGSAVGRSLDTSQIRDVLLSNLDHPRWTEVAERCLACANCTMVCPTCFCSHVEEVADLTGDHVQRERSWASCFTAEHSYMDCGSVRKTIASRYRQWLTHKLATWIDQFGTSGCVGCGRCITWCPVGIDLTEEVAAIRETST